MPAQDMDAIDDAEGSARTVTYGVGLVAGGDRADPDVPALRPRDPLSARAGQARPRPEPAASQYGPQTAVAPESPVR